MYILVFNAHITLGMVITPNTRGQLFVLNLSSPNMNSLRKQPPHIGRLSNPPRPM